MEKINNFYVIATPIGNLSEVNSRMLITINEIDYLFCEDTRITQKLLNLIGVQKFPKLISYHKFNEKSKLRDLIDLVKTYKCGLISDAGYPTISDPGQLIIQTIRNILPLCHIEVINCANAGICALVGSGFNSTNFYFAGFLDRNNIKQELENLLNIKSTIIFYESVHRIQTTLKLIDEYFLNKPLCVARELTKKNETYYFGTGKEISERLTLKGEFVIIIDNHETNRNKKLPINKTHIQDIEALLKLNVRLKDACKFIAKKSNLNNSDLYDFFKNKNDK